MTASPTTPDTPTPPCALPDAPDWWVSERKEDRARAGDLCRTCPRLLACQSEAQEMNNRPLIPGIECDPRPYGVWDGLSYYGDGRKPVSVGVNHGTWQYRQGCRCQTCDEAMKAKHRRDAYKARQRRAAA